MALIGRLLSYMIASPVLLVEYSVKKGSPFLGSPLSFYNKSEGSLRTHPE